MKLEAFKDSTYETFVEGHDVTATVHAWSNGEGANVMLHGKGDGGLALRAAFAGRWEELDVLLVALTAARSAP